MHHNKIKSLMALCVLTSALTVSFADAATATVTKAVAKVNPTVGNQVTGTVTFEVVDKGVLIVGDFEGLKPGLHGFHVHEKGECNHDASSAGGHFNPAGTKHGGPDDKERHAGDFGNVEANAEGKAHYERIDTVIKLEGADSIVDKSIVIHADPDDFKTQPTGNSGARIGCGVIQAVK